MKDLKLTLIDVVNLLANIRALNEAVILAAEGLSDRDHTDAIQAIGDEIKIKLLAARDQLDELRDDLP